MSLNHIIALAIATVVLALSYAGCYQSIKLPKRVSGVVAVAFGLITYIFLLENPDILFDTSSRIALLLIATVVGVALSVRRIFG